MTVMWQIDLGRMAYEPVWALQHRVVERRIAGEGPDTLLYVEHDPVITLGRRADPAHILASPEALREEGIHVIRIERGGDVTYHGPGQLVGYPIVHLPSLGLGASDWMHALEDALAWALADLGIATHRREGVIGVWVGDNKIAALGVRIRRGVTFHGFALNVAPNMAHWSLIVPCGIRDGGVTSIAAELGMAPAMADVQALVSRHLAEVLHVQLEPHEPSELPAVTVGDVV